MLRVTVTHLQDLDIVLTPYLYHDKTAKVRGKEKTEWERGMARRNNNTFSCTVEMTLDVIGGKWKGVIIFHLLRGTHRFNELRRLMPNVTQRILTLQLRELEADGIIQRVVYAEVPPRVEYSLTPFGQTLEPIILLMRTWGTEYEDKIMAQRDVQIA